MARLNEPPVAPAAATLANGAPVENIDVCEYDRVHVFSTPQERHTSLGMMRTKSLVIRERPAANIDEVKRRFIRQNRELAKNNSSQSLRIRSLELEVERILTDNLELRARIVELENQLFDAQTQISSSAVDELKRALYGKIAELTGVVRSVDALKTQEKRTVDKQSILSPSQRQYRERQPLSEIMRDSQMPTIIEGRRLSRRSLDAEDHHIFNRLSGQSNSSGSPDLGPPPVARLDYEGTTNETSDQLASSPVRTGEELLAESLSINLETRRKRRENQPRPDMRRHSILSQSPVKGGEEASTILRTGAKRKLADREVEKANNVVGQADFAFTRKTSSANSAQSDEDVFTRIERPIRERLAEQGDRTRPQSPQTKPARKALSEKSANMSPRKTQQAAEEKPQKPGLEKTTAPKFGNAPSKDRSSLRSRRVSSIPLPPPATDEPPNTISIPAPDPLDLPLTGALEDMLSPALSNPSPYPSDALQKCDTPPPADLSATSNTADGAGSRPSRRARSAVNYAEPSLIAKMRRPDKNMVDAVAGLRGTAGRTAPTGRKSTEPASVSVKKETQEEDERTWKDLPASREERSPLGLKSGEAQMVRQSASNGDPEEDHDAVAATTTSIPSLNLSRKRREPSSGTLLTRFTAPQGGRTSSDLEAEAAAKKLEELDLYEFKDSSPTSSNISSSPPTKVPGQIRGHRRHSSVPKEPRPGELSSGRVKPAEERNLGRRKSMML